MEKKPKIVLVKDREPFYEYLSSHPHLYDGVDLTGAEIDYINNEFWFMDVNPGNFQPIFVHKIRKYIAQYKNLKAIEFVPQVFNIATNKDIRHIVQRTTSELQSKTSSVGNTSNSHNDTTSDNGDTKSANRQLPMESRNQGTEFSDLIDWEQGASNISQVDNSNTTSNNGSYTIKQDDQTLLNNLGKGTNNQDIVFERQGQQAVDCIKKIWNYILEPKALEWFCHQLESAFILVY